MPRTIQAEGLEPFQVADDVPDTMLPEITAREERKQKVRAEAEKVRGEDKLVRAIGTWKMPTLLKEPDEPGSVEDIMARLVKASPTIPLPGGLQVPSAAVAEGTVGFARGVDEAVQGMVAPENLPLVPLAFVPGANVAMGAYFGGKSIKEGVASTATALGAGDVGGVGRGLAQVATGGAMLAAPVAAHVSGMPLTETGVINRILPHQPSADFLAQQGAKGAAPSGIPMEPAPMIMGAPPSPRMAVPPVAPPAQRDILANAEMVAQLAEQPAVATPETTPRTALPLEPWRTTPTPIPADRQFRAVMAYLAEKAGPRGVPLSEGRVLFADAQGNVSVGGVIPDHPAVPVPWERLSLTERELRWQEAERIARTYEANEAAVRAGAEGPSAGRINATLPPQGAVSPAESAALATQASQKVLSEERRGQVADVVPAQRFQIEPPPVSPEAPSLLRSEPAVPSEVSPEAPVSPPAETPAAPAGGAAALRQHLGVSAKVADELLNATSLSAARDILRDALRKKGVETKNLGAKKDAGATHHNEAVESALDESLNYMLEEAGWAPAERGQQPGAPNAIQVGSPTPLPVGETPGGRPPLVGEVRNAEVAPGARPGVGGEAPAGQPEVPLAKPGPGAIGIAPPGAAYVQRVIDYFRPPRPNATPEVAVQEGGKLVRFMPYATEKALTTTPEGVARIPILGQLLDPRASAHSEAARSVIARQATVEKGKTLSALWAQSQFRARPLFDADATGVISLANGKKGYMSDVIEAEMRAPGSQSLTTEQRAWIREEWIPLKSEVDAWLKSEGVRRAELDGDAYTVGEAYFPRPAIDKRNVPDKLKLLRGLSGGAERPGAKPFFEKRRLFDTERAGVDSKDSIIYDPNAVSRVARWLNGVYRSVADHRLANDPALGGVTVTDRLASLKGEHHKSLAGVTDLIAARIEQIREAKRAKDPALATLQEELTEYRRVRSTMLRELRDEAAHPVWMRESGVTGVPAFAGKIFEPEVAALLHKYYGQQTPYTLAAALNINAISKSIRAVGDLSQLSLQLGGLLGRHPHLWGRAAANTLKSIIDPDTVGKLLEKEHYKTAAAEFTQSGGALRQLSDFLEGVNQLGPLERVPVVGKAVKRVAAPVLKRAAGSYATALDVAKLELWRSYSPLTPKEQWARLAETIDNALGTGRMEAIGLSKHRIEAERGVFFAPSYYRAYLNTLASAVRSGGVPGRLARNMVGGQAMAALLTFTGGALAAGLSWDEIKRRLDPARGKFMTVPVTMPDGSKLQVGFGGMFIQSIRAGAQFTDYLSKPPPEDTGVLHNPLLRYFRGRAALFPSLAMDVTLGRDYMDNRLTIRGAALRAFVPFWIQSFLPGEERQTATQRIGDAMFNFVGLRSFPQGEYEAEKAKIDAIAQQTSGKPFVDLSLGQRRNAIKRYQASPDYKKREPTLEDQKRFIEFGERRRLNLERSLAPATKERIDALGLRVYGFRSTVTDDNVHIPLTDEEQVRYEELLAAEYNTFFSKIRMPSWQKLPARIREKMWSDNAAKINERARTRLQSEINKRTRPQ